MYHTNSLKRKITVLFAAPAIVFGAILLYFVFYNVWVSMHSGSKFIGLSAYSIIFSSSSFRSTVAHSLIWSFIIIVVGNILGMLFAGLIFYVNSNRLRTVFLSVFVYPLAISSAASAVIWMWMYNYSSGIDILLTKIGFPAIHWVNYHLLLYSLILVSVWTFTGLAAIFYYASFNGINKSVIESAHIDGAGPFRILVKILIPEAKNAFIVSTALLFIFTLRIFSLPYVAEELNPFSRTMVEQVFYYYISIDFPEASAVSVIIILIGIVVIIPFALIGIKRWLKLA